MNFGTTHDVAPDGVAVNSVVSLLLPDDDQPFPRLPWRAQTRAGSGAGCTSHHLTRADADKHADKMHAAYMEVHS